MVPIAFALLGLQAFGKIVRNLKIVFKGKES